MRDNRRYHLTILAACAMIGACNDTNLRKTAEARGDVADTGNALSVTPAEGGIAKLTATDSKSVYVAGKYRLTETNFRQFLAATDSVLALSARDASVRDFLGQQVTDAGNGTQVVEVNAGLKRLENNPAVASAITSTGMSVRDYFVAAIAIAQGERFMGNPAAAPASAALRPNADFLAEHRTELTALRAREHGDIIVR